MTKSELTQINKRIAGIERIISYLKRNPTSSSKREIIAAQLRIQKLREMKGKNYT